MNSDVEVVPTLPAGLPDDWLLEIDLPCPTCRYNLRKLHSPRCPECGGAFRWQMLLSVSCPRCDAPLATEDGALCPTCGLELDWARLLGEVDPARLKQFEYTGRPVRAAFQSWIAALTPQSFWREIRLESPPAVARLKWLRAAALLVFALGLLSTLASITHVLGGTWNVFSPATAVEILAGWIAPAVLPSVTVALMPIFTPTLSRFRIRRDQLVRIFAYGAAGLFWLGMAYVAMALATAGFRFLPRTAIARLAMPTYPDLMLGLEFFSGGGPATSIAWMPRSNIALSAILVALIAAIGFAWWWRFLFVSLGTYLRLRRRDVWALFVSTQLIAILITWLALLSFGGYGWARFFGSFLF